MKKMYMSSSRANASARQHRAGGASMEPNITPGNEKVCTIQPKQMISVKQAIIIINNKLSNIEQKLIGNNSYSIDSININSETKNDLGMLNTKYGTLEMRVSELTKKNELLSNELNSVKQKSSSSINELKDMIMKMQTLVTETQSMVIKNTTK